MRIMDQFAGTLDTFRRKLDSVRASQDRLHKQGAQSAAAAGRSFDNFRLKQIAAFSDGERHANRFQQAFGRTTSAIQRHSGAVVGVTRAVGRELNSLANLTARWGTVAGAAGAGGVALLVRQGVKLNSDMVRYRVTLETMMKSQARANGLIRWMYQFTERTPFQVTGMAEAVTQLEAFGLKAQRWAPVIGNWVAAFGGGDEKMQQAIRSVSFLKSGRTGEAFESMTRLGISRQDFVRQGLQFDKGGSLIGDPENALDALERIVNSRFPGLMDRISMTFEGTMSNLQDVGQNFLRDTTKGLFDAMAKDARSVLDTLEGMRSDGRLAMLRDQISGALTGGFEKAKEFLRSDIIDVLESKGLGGVFENLFEKAKGPAGDFLGWFAGQMSRAMVGAVKLAFTDADVMKFSALWLGMRNAGNLVAFGASMLPGLARGAGAAFAAGGRSLASRIGSWGDRFAAGAVGASNTATRIPTGLAAVASRPGFTDLIGGTVAGRFNQGARIPFGASSPSRLTGGTPLFGVNGGVDPLGAGLAFNPNYPAAVPYAAPGGGVGGFASDAATFAGLVVGERLMRRGAGLARSGIGRLAARLFPTAARAAAGGGAFLGLEAAYPMIAAGGSGVGASLMSAGAAALPYVGAGGVAAGGIASLVDSISATRNASEMAWWNLPGRAGRWTRNQFSNSEYIAPRLQGLIDEQKSFQVDKWGQSGFDVSDGRILTMLQAAGPEAAKRLQNKIDREAKIPQASKQLQGQVGAMGDEFLSLNDSLLNFRDQSKSTIEEMAQRLTNQGSGLVSGFSTLQEKIDRISQESLPRLRSEADRLAKSRAGLAFDPANPQDYAFNMERLGLQSARNSRSIFEERINLEALRFMQLQEQAAENQGFLGKYLQARQGGDSGELLQLFREGARVRELGDGRGLSSDRLAEIQGATGIDLSKIIRPMLMNELRRDLVDQFGPDLGSKIFKEAGAFETDTDKFARSVDKMVDEFRAYAGAQAEELAVAGDSVHGKLIEAFNDGAAQAAETIASAIGVTAARVSGEEVRRMVAEIVSQLGASNRDRAAIQSVQGFGEG